MAKIVIDEDMHKSVAEPLEQLDYETMDIRDHGLRGSNDQEVYEFAQKNKAALISGDKDFEALKGVSPDDITKNLVIVTPGRVRIRKEME